MLKMILVFCLLAVILPAQTAVAVRIPVCDAEPVREKHEAYLQAKAEFDKAVEALTDKHLRVESTHRDAGNMAFSWSQKRARRGFEYGADFTPDFRVAVAKPAPKFAASTIDPWINTPVLQNSYTPGESFLMGDGTWKATPTPYGTAILNADGSVALDDETAGYLSLGEGGSKEGSSANLASPRKKKK